MTSAVSPTLMTGATRSSAWMTSHSPQKKDREWGETTSRVSKVAAKKHV